MIMGLPGDEVGSSEDRAALHARVVNEVARLLDAVPEVDLATVYRTLVGLMGAHVVPHIAEAVGAGLRDGGIQMDTRVVNPRAPAVAFVRRGPGRRAA